MSDDIQAIDTVFFAPQQSIGGSASAYGPAFIYFQNHALAIWRGAGGDNGIYWRIIDQPSFNYSQQRIPDVGSSYAVSLAVYGNLLYAAWRGVGDDNGIYYCTSSGIDANNPASAWNPQARIPNAGTGEHPSLAIYNGLLFAAWRGEGDDNGIYWCSFDGSDWSDQQTIPNTGSGIGPSLAAVNNKLYAAWRGVDDQGMYWSQYDGQGWSPQQIIPNAGSATGPSLTGFGQRLYAFWRGVDDDNGIYWCSTDGTGWTVQQQLPGVGTGNRPVATGAGGLLFLGWKGIGDDQSMYWTSGSIGSVYTMARFTGNDAATPATQFSRIDVHTMSNGVLELKDNSGAMNWGPYSCWWPSPTAGGDWSATLRGWVSDQRSWSPLAANPCIPLHLVEHAPGDCYLSFIDFHGRVNIYDANIPVDDSRDTLSNNYLGGLTSPQPFLPGTPVTGASRGTTETHFFATGTDGRVYTLTASTSQQGFPVFDHQWRVLAPLQFGLEFIPGTFVCALSRDFRPTSARSGLATLRNPVTDIVYLDPTGNEHLDLFCVDAKGNVQTLSYVQNEWPVGVRWVQIGSGFPAGATVTAIARTQANMDLFIIGNDGHVYTSSWTSGDGWNGQWKYIGGFFPIGNTVTPLSRNPDHIDLYATGFDGRISSNDWDRNLGWNGINKNWREIGGFFPRNAVVSANSRTQNNLDLFVVGNDARVYTSYQANGRDWSGINNDWRPITTGSVSKRSQILTPKGTALGGFVELTIYASGNYEFTCYMHDSGAAGYDFTVRALFTTPQGRTLFMTHSGHVGTGFLSSGSRDDLHQETGTEWQIHAYWADFAQGVFNTSTDYSMTGLPGLLDDVVKEILDLGVTVVGFGVGILIAIGNEAGKIVGDWGLGGVFGIVGGIVLCVVGGSVVLAVAAGIAIGEVTEALVQTRNITQAEYDFASKCVFGKELPDVNTIKITNLSGLSGRAFTMPGMDGTIYLNLGDAYTDPMNYKGDYNRKGQKLIHELTHAWQINQNSFQAGLVCDAIVTQTNYQVGEDVYAYGPPTTPWSDFGLEQQAAVVDNWYGGNANYSVPFRNQSDKKDPYYHYITDNIQAGVD